MFVIVRHGNTFAAGETPRRIGARTDLPLTEKGREQARALAALFAAQGWVFARALVSPLLRTRETAQIILDAQHGAAKAEPCAWLREIDHGPDEDRSEEAVLARIGIEALTAWERHAAPPPDWQVDAEMRLQGWRDLFAKRDAQGPALLVTSNGAARFALMADPALAAAMDRLDSLKLPTGGYGVIRRSDGGGLMLESWGLRP
ncbi:histidine phosphatase family protein [Novosphingobium sp. PY1]|uniref:Phosphoglycerate mutase n=1 Tax=Ochrobactrum sp. PW1 TaxID=1882222 RepID=A0A292GS61_9HYPH|nr:histidine phosphatase family protein [Novosphingobium sp. PY1]BBA74309.1 phosphoglycerate mutase [Ochrobactrum sp. PW1]GFM29158.1 phosphoglycerate mutase [Novosphingobium sp. PY1]